MKTKKLSILLLFIGCLCPIASAQSLPSFGVVKGSGVRLRNSPSLKGEVVGSVRVGKTKTAIVVVLERSQSQTQFDNHKNYWYRIRASSGEGWCFGEFIEIHPHQKNSEEGWSYRKLTIYPHQQKRQYPSVYMVRKVTSTNVTVDFGRNTTDQSPQWVTVIGAKGSGVATLHTLTIKAHFDPDYDSFEPLGLYRFDRAIGGIGEALLAVEGQHLLSEFLIPDEHQLNECTTRIETQFDRFYRVSASFREPGKFESFSETDLVLLWWSDRIVLHSYRDGYGPAMIKIPLCFSMDGRTYYVIRFGSKAVSDIRGIMSLDTGPMEWILVTAASYGMM